MSFWVKSTWNIFSSYANTTEARISSHTNTIPHHDNQPPLFFVGHHVRLDSGWKNWLDFPTAAIREPPPLPSPPPSLNLHRWEKAVKHPEDVWGGIWTQAFYCHSYFQQPSHCNQIFLVDSTKTVSIPIIIIIVVVVLSSSTTRTILFINSCFGFVFI